MVFDLLSLVCGRAEKPVELVFKILVTSQRHLVLKVIEMLVVDFALCIDKLQVLLYRLLHRLLRQYLLLLQLLRIMALLLLLFSFFALVGLHLVHESAYFAFSGVDYVLQSHGEACLLGELLVFFLNVVRDFKELLLGLFLVLFHASDLDVVQLFGHLLLQDATA